MSLLSQYESITDGVEAINKAMASVFLPKSSISLDSHVCTNVHEDWNVLITPAIISKLFMCLPSSKASPDLPVKLYKSAATFLAEPLSKLFLSSVELGVVPRLWKEAVISPIPKNSTPTLNDLRPISLLRLPAKLLERIVVSSIKTKMLNNYDDCQYGFRPGSSTQCAVIALTDHLTKYLDHPSTCGALIVSYDYSKAFDRLRTDLIVQRLIDCEFPPKCVKWILYYLTARTQHVKVGITRSSAIDITSGVPQGSVIGPYLYALTTATFRTSHSNCHVVKYADDTTICFPIYPLSNPHIRNEHLNLLRWSSSMDLKMNERKCKAVVILKKEKSCRLTRELPEVPVVDPMDILGVCFNSKAVRGQIISIKLSRLLQGACLR